MSKDNRWCQYPMMAAMEKAVFAHFMVSFRHPEVSGQWAGWNHCNEHVSNNPEESDPDGRPHVASVYTPLVGMYDMTDPDIAEHHCQLLKVAGIDGIMFDLSFYHKDDEQWRAKAMRNYACMLKKYGLKAVVIYEDMCHWIWDQEAKTREEAVAGAYADMTSWLETFDDVVYRINGRPLFGFFSYHRAFEGKGNSRLTPGELNTWKNTFPDAERPILVAQWVPEEYRGALDGKYDWILIEGEVPEGTDWIRYMDMDGTVALQDRLDREARENLEQGHHAIHIGGVWPGFDDHGCYGWGDGCRGIPRLDGDMYAYLWERALQNDYPVVQVASWNDWFEGHNIEPAVEFRYQYIKMTQTYAARFKKETVCPLDLGVPELIYKVRKLAETDEAMAAMDKACDAIQRGDYAQAEALVFPWAERLQLADVRYWTQTARRYQNQG